MIVEIDKTNLEGWHNYLAVDRDGTANIFHKIPEKISGKYVPSKFREQNHRSSFLVDDKLFDYSGKVFEFLKIVDNKSYWKDIEDE